MDIVFKNRKVARQFDDAQLLRVHGAKRAARIRARLESLKQAKNLAAFWPPKSGKERCHELKGDMKGYFSMDLDHPYRLIFAPDHETVPELPGGGKDWSAITAIIILGVEDTHE